MAYGRTGCYLGETGKAGQVSQVVATQGPECVHIPPPALPCFFPLRTVQLSLPPTLHLEGFSGKYVAVQLHLHWGQKGSPGGSEHQINSEATAAEVPGSKAWTSAQGQA